MPPPAIVVPGSSVRRVRVQLVRDAERAAEAAGSRLVVLSGLDEAEHMRELWQGADVELALEETATSTVQNAVLTLPFLVERDVHAAIVVCAPAHFLRARWISAKTDPSPGVIRFPNAHP